jgi:hypothetical protein
MNKNNICKFPQKGESAMKKTIFYFLFTFILFGFSNTIAEIPNELIPLLGYWNILQQEEYNYELYLDNYGPITVGGREYMAVYGELILVWDKDQIRKSAGFLTKDYLYAEFKSSEYKYFIIDNRRDRYSGDIKDIYEHYFNFIDDNNIEGVYRWASTVWPISVDWESFIGEKDLTYSTTTTTSTKYIPPCLTEQIYDEDSEEVELLRYFRDNLLMQTPEGREIIRLYYQWSPTIIEMMHNDPQLAREIKEAIAQFLGINEER